jgi:hypothetical protein
MSIELLVRILGVLIAIGTVLVFVFAVGAFIVAGGVPH